jgi:hypothetical protein
VAGHGERKCSLDGSYWGDASLGDYGSNSMGIRKSKYDYRVLMDKNANIFLMKWDCAVDRKDWWHFRGLEKCWWLKGKYETPKGFTELERTDEYYYDDY